MSNAAELALPRLMRIEEDPAALTDLVSVLLASGDIFYEWDLTNGELTWMGGTDGVMGVIDTGHINSGDRFLQRIHPEDLPHRMLALALHFEQQQIFDVEYRVRGDTGEFQWIRERAIAAKHPSGKPERLTGVVRNIDESKRSEEAVSFLTNHDVLTGQFNRPRLREVLEQTLEATIRSGKQGAFLLVGVDKLNIVADVYGEDTADTVVLAAARRIESCLRSGDIVGRVGFDRFAVVLTSCTEHQIASVADRFLAAIRETAMSTQVGPMYVTASVGATVFPVNAATAREVVGQADNALRSARRLGCDCFLEYRDVPAHFRADRPDLIIAEQVKQALRDDRFTLAYQPVVSAENGDLVFYEGLARMLDEDGKPVAAGGFVPIVEQMGMMRLIDRRVLDLGVETLRNNPEVSLSINVSGLTAVDPVWLRQLHDHLKPHPKLAERLTFEITETVALDDITESSRFVRALNEFGCHVALDDFGAGFTSFRHLRSLNVDIVKIDGSFVRGLPENPENQLFVETLLNLAKGIGLRTVAEWVENEEEAEMLRKIGVEYLQGWHCGRPETDPDWKK